MRLIKLPQVVLNTAFALGALTLTATVAHAETGIDSTPTPSSAGSLPPPSSAPVVEPLPPLTPPGYSTAHPYVPNKIGGALLVGGGYEDFTNSTINQMTSGGGAWNARVVAGTRQFVGLEAAYVGAARSIDALGLSQ